MSSHYPSKRTNKEKLISLHVNNCECGVAVGHPFLSWGQGLGFDQWWYPLLHTAPPFLQKHLKKIIIIIKKKIKQNKNKKKKKNKKKNLLNYVMTWSLSRVRRQLSILCWVQSRTKKKMKEQRIKSPLLINERKIVQEESMLTYMKGIKTKEITTSISNLSS